MRSEKPTGHDRNVRQGLLAAGTRLFNRRGYSATSVREIVAAVGVTKPVLYHYFSSKEGLYLEIMNEFVERFEKRLEALHRQGGSAKERIVHFCDDVFSLCLERVESVRLMYSSYFGPPQGAPAVDFEALYARVFNAIRRVVEQGIRAGEFRRYDPREMTWALLGVMTVALEAELANSPLSMGRRGLKRILGLIFSGIAGQKPKRKGHRTRESKSVRHSFSPGGVRGKLRLLPQGTE
jgi:AcrR family transcriptional regulator